MKTKTLEVLAGKDITSACREASVMAAKENCNVEFGFNDQKITATPTSDYAKLVQQYHAECERLRAEYVASPEYRQREKEYERKERKERKRVTDLNVMLADAPDHMTLSDPAGWKQSCDANKDGYGGAVMAYAERWARLMEARISKGEKISDIADKCSHLANSEGITGFMYGCAVSILSKVWKHGDDLRRWHNVATQVKDEGERANETGGVLNPALLTIS